MKCPSCKEKAINFGKWAKGLNAFKYNCQSCNQELRANIVTYVLFLSTLIAVFFAFPYVKEAWIFFGLEFISSKFEKFLLVPVIIVGGVLTWFLGGYKTKK